jgi:hypothetical protein
MQLNGKIKLITVHQPLKPVVLWQKASPCIYNQHSTSVYRGCMPVVHFPHCSVRPANQRTVLRLHSRMRIHSPTEHLTIYNKLCKFY